jgi:two-component system sensor histidine kinase AgrC
MPDLHVFLITCCFISSGLFALSCTKSFLSVCKLRKGFSAIAYFLTTVLMQVLGTAVCIFVFDCRYLVPTIVLVHFSVSLLFTDSLWRMRYYAAGVHAFLFTASRTIITKLLSIVTNKAAPIFTTETTSETTLVPIAVLTASFLVTCLLERIALNACTVDGARAPAFSPKMLNYLCVSVTLFLGFTLCEASINETHAGVRAFAFSHLCLCLLLYGGVWLLAKYHATITHISETKRSDTRRREERYYSYYITQAQTLEEMRRFRHDYKNMLSGLKVLIDSGEYKRASEYLSSIATRFDGMSKKSVSYSDNMLADAVLQNLARRCESAGVTFSGSLSISKEIPLGDPELCTVLSNLADNAFEAVQKVPEGERFITFSGSRRVKWLTITVENSYDGVLFTDRGSIVTRKEDRVMHGLGLKSICSIVESVPGASVRIEPSPEEKIFRVTLLFPRPQAEKKNSDDSAETQA